MRWVKLILVNVAVLGVLIVLGLVIAEVYLRATIPASTGGSVYESTLSTRRYKVMRPNARIQAWGRELRTNELGFRDNKSIVPPKRPGSFRMVVLGDSFTVSAGVEFPKIFTSLLQEMLSRDRDVEVINLAVGGYNIIQYELVLDEVAMSLRPDLVLVALFPFNDFSSDTYRANFKDAMGLSKPVPATSWYEDLYVYRAYLNRLEDRVRRMWRASNNAKSTVKDREGQDRVEDAERNLSALQRIMSKAAAAGVPVIIAILPNTDTFDAQEHDLAPLLRLCKEEHWYCINLIEQFSASTVTPGSLRLNALDSHPNELYNSMVAEFLSESLRPFVVKPAMEAAP